MRRFPAEPGELTPIVSGWRMAGTRPGELREPAGLEALRSVPALVPGTVAGALSATGSPSAPGHEVEPEESLDARDWWFWTRFQVTAPEEGEELRLWLDGLATVTEVYLDGNCVLRSESMYERHCVALPDAGGEHQLAICCRALTPLLQERRRPRARWRTRLVAEGNLRFWRTMLLGRAPGFVPGPAVVGPWRPIVLERRVRPGVDVVSLRPGVDGRGGALTARVELSGPVDAVTLRLTGPGGTVSSPLHVDGSTAGGTLSVPEVERWWPHTHGTPTLYHAELELHTGPTVTVVDAGRVGFRDLAWPEDLERDGLSLSVNGTPVFARGAVWTPHDLRAPHAGRDQLRSVLERVCAAGMNMLRVPGIACYESPDFHDLCDELGVLVWQDFMFANLDYPESEAAFMATVDREARQVAEDLGGRPSLAVLCGGSEVAQQVAMLGLAPELAEGLLYGELLPKVSAEMDLGVPYLPSTPWGGDLPFRTDRGVANYYGVGAYLRALSDVRMARVRFAGECLAFANVPDEDALAGLGAPGSERWKRGVPRDVGADWDFDDVRDHYLGRLFELDPAELRRADPDRYLALSRQVTGEVMAAVFGEWRRSESECAGGLVLWLADLAPGAGWGLFDHRGEAKLAWHHLRRALRPVAVWSTDEGLGGVNVHVANDRGTGLRTRLRIALYRQLETRIEEASTELTLGPHETWTTGVEALLGRFVDASYAYRFGAPGHDLIVFSLEDPAGRPISEACRFPISRPRGREPAAELGVTAVGRGGNSGEARVIVSSRRFLYGARLMVPGWRADDDGFFIEPGHSRELALRPAGPDPDPDRLGKLADGWLTAINLAGRVPVGR